MSRALQIIKYLEASFAVTAQQLADELRVTSKTVSNEMVSINKAFCGVAEITFAQGVYRLVIFDREGFELRKGTLVAASRSYNSSEARQAYIFERLASAYGPVLVSILASEMSISRSTVNQDLSKLRDSLHPYTVSVEGRPNSGIEIIGDELAIRLVILDKFYTQLYGISPLPAQIAEQTLEIAREHGLQKAAAESLIRWLTVLVDRSAKHSPLLDIPPKITELKSNSAYLIAQQVTSLLGEYTGQQLPEAEVFYMTLPLAAMRGQDNQDALSGFLSEDRAHTVSQKIIERIYNDMGLNFAFDTLHEEFRIHIGFLLNRVKFGIQVTRIAPGINASRYPLAFELAKVAQKVIEEESGGELAFAELCLLSIYFQVNLESIFRSARASIRIAVVYSFGKVEGHMLLHQVEAALPGTGGIEMFSQEEATRQVLDTFDVVVLKGGSENPSGTPSIRVAEYFDSAELCRKIDALCIEKSLGARVAFGGASWIVTLLNREAFYPLQPGDYESNLVELLAKLKKDGLITEPFESRMLDRELQGTMKVTEDLSFPHLVSTDNQLIIALGVCPDRGDGKGHLVVLVALPQEVSGSSATLVGIYQEVMRLATAPHLIQGITGLTTANQFKSFMATYGGDILKEN